MPLRPADGWTRLVRILRIVLPLTALALLSTVFLVARHLNPEDAIPYSEVDIADRLREPRMTRPVYAGATADGSDLRVTAESATPEQVDAGKGAAAAQVRGTVRTPDGATSEVQSTAAEMDAGGSSVTFSGGVDLANSAGYRIRTESMRARLDQTELRSLSPVQAEGPGTTITAREMVLTRQAGEPDRYVLVFNGDVKLVYLPPK